MLLLPRLKTREQLLHALITRKITPSHLSKRTHGYQPATQALEDYAEYQANQIKEMNRLWVYALAIAP